ncbi:MAG TPA: PEP-CTERM sorting domain-containing protein [Candidatus Paceibacterota bacterium]|nr:PEP-CTERM sorting domain-containing protein [Verrucomicrobiota bacterium]HSA09627.1 PEP-CTERM sorting domain-containing protein [Candidatus Paceibacterota bacterium]
MKTREVLPYCGQTRLGERPLAIRISLLLCAACLLVQSVQADLLFHEGFDYSAGVGLAGQGNWVQTTNSAYITVGSGNLTYPDLPDSVPPGNRARIAGMSAAVQGFAYSPFSESVNNGVVYASFLLDFNGTVAGGNYTFMGLLPYADNAPGNGGVFNNTYDPCDLVSKGSSGNVQLGIRTLGQGTSYANPTLSLGSVNLIVMKYDFDLHRASLFINPSPVEAEPAASIASTGTTSAESIGQFYLRIGGYNQADYLVDNVRVGTQWADVVPEPGSVSLLALGMLGLFRRARR